jgi:hypothetical protein
MKEKKTRRVMVPPGVSVSSFKGFLEFIYLGKPGSICDASDGRQLWVLAEMYNIPELKKWLQVDAINQWTVCATYEFALVPQVPQP